MIVASHRRSGTHFLMQSLALTFGGRFPVFKTHGLAGEVLARKAKVERIHGTEPPPSAEEVQRQTLYIVRDVRDCLTSNYHWWRTSMESKCGGILPHFHDVTPQAYLGGAVALRAVPSPDPGCSVTQAHIDIGIFSDPAGFWARHVASYLEADLPIIRYEDLLQSPRRTLLQIAERFGLKRPWFPRAPRRLVGHDPRKGVIGDHKSLFDAGSLRLIAGKAGRVMERLGYDPL